MKFKVEHVMRDQPYPRRIDFIKAVRSFSGLGLREAKDICDNVTFHDVIEFEIDVTKTDSGLGHGDKRTLITEARCAGITMICTQSDIKTKLHEALVLAVDDKDYNTSQRILDILIDLSKK